MAAAAEVQLVTITINDVEVQVPKGELIVESVKRLGLEIPIFCYHPRMKPVGMCRMCLVEVGFKQADGSVRKMPKPQAGCTLPADNNMVIYTDTEMVHRDRKGVLEFLLINHPLDCPICDRGGECPLQNNTIAYGPSTSRFTEMKRHLPKAYPLSKYVTLDLERCIQCGRCVRFTEEISGEGQLAFRFRGAEMQPSTFQLTDFESKFSGNVIEICPVGALTSSYYRFRARPWDLETRPGLCTVTPCGTNVWFDFRAGKFIRINGRINESVNEEWTCDKTKFGHEFYNDPSRLKAPNVRDGAGFRGASWSDAYAEILPRFENCGSEVGILAGSSQLSNEDYFALQKLTRAQFKSSNLDTISKEVPLPWSARIENKHGIAPVQSAIADLELQDAVLVFGTSLADDQPMSFLRLRKGWRDRGTKVVVAHHEATEVDQFASVILRFKPGTESYLASALAGAMTSAEAESKTGVSSLLIDEAKALLGSGSRTTITTSSTQHEAREILALWAKASGAIFNYLVNGANQRGAWDMGVLPDTLPGGAKSDATGLNSTQMLEAAARGELKSLWLVGCDPIAEHPDRDLAIRALENVDFLVVQHYRQTESAAYASVVLPMCLPAEQDGTYTSSERRVQRMKQILTPPGESKPSWRIFSECAFRLAPVTPAFNAGEVMAEIGRTVPEYLAAAYENLNGEGVRLGLPKAEAAV